MMQQGTEDHRMEITSVGIDLGKTTFHLVGLEVHGRAVIKRKFSRRQLLAYTANLPTSLIGIEACSGAHFIGAALRDQGHDVRLIPAQFVKPFLKSNNNDFLDAEAIRSGGAAEHALCADHDRRPTILPECLSPASLRMSATPAK